MMPILVPLLPDSSIIYLVFLFTIYSQFSSRIHHVSLSTYAHIMSTLAMRILRVLIEYFSISMNIYAISQL